MAKFFTAKKSIGTLSEINLTSLIDVVFNLLIIFMIITPLVHKGIDVQVPDSSVGEVSPEETSHIVSITKQGTIWFDDRQITFDQLAGYVQGLPAEETIYVQADKHISYGTVIDVISAVKKQGIRRVGLVTNPVEEGKTP